jgi:hypothetical protein
LEACLVGVAGRHAAFTLAASKTICTGASDSARRRAVCFISNCLAILERAKRFEPSTLTLARLKSMFFVFYGFL